VGGLWLGIFLLLAAPAPGQAASCHANPECAELLARGQKESKEQSYELALTDFQAAYAKVPDPVLLVNIGRAHYRLGQPERAIEYYLRFQGAVPTPEPQLAQMLDRYMVEARLLHEQHQHPSSPVSPPPAPRPIYKKWSFREYLRRDWRTGWNRKQQTGHSEIHQIL
jgi:tetratricopeptide (TPR) repeat protein